AALRPATSGLVLLADACLVGEPDFYRVAVERLGARDFLQAHGKAFLKSSIAPCALRMVARSGREFAVAHGAQLPAARLLGDRDAESLEVQRRQIDQPPAHHAMDRRDRAALDHAGDGPPLKVIELARLTRRLAVQESVRPASVEAQHPVPDDLKPDAADLGRLGARRTVIDRRKRQKPPGLGPSLVLLAKLR